MDHPFAWGEEAAAVLEDFKQLWEMFTDFLQVSAAGAYLWWRETIHNVNTWIDKVVLALRSDPGAIRAAVERVWNVDSTYVVGFKEAAEDLNQDRRLIENIWTGVSREAADAMNEGLQHALNDHSGSDPAGYGEAKRFEELGEALTAFADEIEWTAHDVIDELVSYSSVILGLITLFGEAGTYVAPGVGTKIGAVIGAIAGLLFSLYSAARSAWDSLESYLMAMFALHGANASSDGTGGMTDPMPNFGPAWRAET